jgi:hypothetical protein
MSESKSKLKEITSSLVKNMQQMAKEAGAKFNEQDRRIAQLESFLEAVIQFLGPDEIGELVIKNATARKAEAEAQQKEGVKNLIDKKILVPANEIVSPNGFFVGTEKIKEGGVESRIQFEVASLNPQVHPTFLGKKVGDVIENEKATLTITEIYTIDEAQYKKAVEEEKNAVAPPAEEPKAETLPTPDVILYPPPPALKVVK